MAHEFSEKLKEFIEFNVLWFTAIILSFLILFSLGLFPEPTHHSTFGAFIITIITIVVSYLVSYVAYRIFRGLSPKDAW